MVDELVEIVKNLNKTDEKIDEIRRQWTVLKYEYRKTRDDMLKLEIKKKWDKLQKKMDTLQERRRIMVEKKNEIYFKKRWELLKLHKMEIRKFLNALTS
jgi:predicted nuclease with TOPRIM domain